LCHLIAILNGMANVYILYSEKIDSYYIGSCKNLDQRFKEHVNGKNKQAFTRRAADWRIFLSIENLPHSEARQIETHIKRMKSRIYLNNLLKYPDIIIRLKEKYCLGSFR
jgi:putative endonuclease